MDTLTFTFSLLISVGLVAITYLLGEGKKKKRA